MSWPRRKIIFASVFPDILSGPQRAAKENTEESFYR